MLLVFIADEEAVGVGVDAVLDVLRAGQEDFEGVRGPIGRDVALVRGCRAAAGDEDELLRLCGRDVGAELGVLLFVDECPFGGVKLATKDLR